jgi:hypothetical protein
MLRFTISAEPRTCCKSLGLQTSDAIDPDDLDALMRAYGGLEGLARELDWNAPIGIEDAEEANDDMPRRHVGLWRRMIRALT